MNRIRCWSAVVLAVGCIAGDIVVVSQSAGAVVATGVAGSDGLLPPIDPGRPEISAPPKPEFRAHEVALPKSVSSVATTGVGKAAPVSGLAHGWGSASGWKSVGIDALLTAASLGMVAGPASAAEESAIGLLTVTGRTATVADLGWQLAVYRVAGSTADIAGFVGGRVAG